MRKFGGFPLKTDYAPVPLAFFSTLLPEITDAAELKTTLFLFRILYLKKGFPRYITYRELAADAGLLFSLRPHGTVPGEALRRSMAAAVKRGTVLHLALTRNTGQEDIYLLNTVRDREALEKVKNGEIRLPGLELKPPAGEILTEPAPNIFTKYEENIGLLTPLIAEQLKEAETLYPEQWIIDAFKEAVIANKRSWRYISHLLERWATEGKKDGTYQRDTKATDPDKFVKGKYGHLFQR
ncbi:MAG: DnaD domain protein [Dehalococcoidia bacterium]|nr:DnaD domain protein [Dehalococcoidia bacterium]